MCGIFALFDIKNSPNDLMRKRSLEMIKLVRHRGPDWSGIFTSPNAILAHERLCIVDINSGKQPIKSEDEDIILSVNGEIYNHKKIRNNKNIKYNYLTNSDCEVILSLYQNKGINFLNELNGIFAFALYDAKKNEYLIARDPIGVIPLYIGWDEYDNLNVASEMKSLVKYCKKIEEFPPGHYYSSKSKKYIKYHKKDWMDYNKISKNKTSISSLKKALEQSVKNQLMSDVPFGVLLSGGLDSSIIAALVKKFSKKRIESDDKKDAWWPQIHSFAIGLENSPDLEASREAANYIGTVHHEKTFTIQEGFDAIRDVIYFLETYDVTTVRASTPMYLLARIIKSMGIKMVLSGEGADEIFGGYLYFHKAPNAKEFHEETVRKLNKLHLYDCLRANKSMAAWGVECRVPFLDKDFLDVSMAINPKDKMIGSEKMEKWILRKAFENELPKNILWRQKEQFSDGVGYGWIDFLKEYVESNISDKEFNMRNKKFPINTPKTKEEYYYRNIFEEFYKSEYAIKPVPSSKSVACSTEEALLWDKDFQNLNDPSGRIISDIHKKSYF